MRKTRPFRVSGIENLEGRTVPSGFGSLPQQDAAEVAQAYQTFAGTYAKDVNTILLPTGTTSPSSNRAAFDAAVGTALTTLNTTIDKDIANLPSATTLGATIQAELLGTASTTLQAGLTAVATPASSSFLAEIPFINGSVGQIIGSLGQVTKQVATAPAPSQAITQQTIQQDLAAIYKANQTFNLAYAKAINADLNPPSSSNRAAFDAAVGTALTTLNTSLTAAVSNLPASVASSLESAYSSALLKGISTSGESLQSLLAALPTPTGLADASGFIFRFGSGLEINAVQGEVTYAFVTSVQQYNSSH